MEWVVGIQIDADACIVYVHMDDLKRCAAPDPEPTWPDTARGTSIVVSTRAPSTFALSDTTRSQNHNSITSQRPRSSAHHTKSISSGYIDVRAPTNDENIVKIDTVPDSIVKTDTVPSSTWDLQDAKCILSMKSDSVYATALTSARKMCVQRKLLTWPSWITLPTRVTRGQVLA